MPLRNDLLNPVSEDKPSGENLRYAPVYDKIKEARREEDDAPQGLWQRERKVADWALTVKLISETLATKTKDLQLVAWLAEAMLKREGVAGLRATIDLGRGFLENFWDTLYPELEDGDSEFRSAPLQWVGDRLDLPLKQSGITKSGLSFLQYKESRAIGTEESANTNEKKVKRTADIAAGKIPQEDFDKAFDESPKSYYVNLIATFDGTTESIRSLKEADALADKINRDVVECLKNPEFIEKTKALGMDLAPGSRADAAAFFAQERALWANVIKQADIPLQ
jgi:type VI secretion system protein ImpA